MNKTLRIQIRWLLVFTTIGVCLGIPLTAVQAEPSSKLELASKERQWLEEHKGNIRYAPSPNYPPIGFVENGKFKGVTAEYIRIIEERLNIRFEMVYCETWNQLMEKARLGQVDMVGNIQNTPQRREFLRFTSPYIRIPNSIIMKEEFKGTVSPSEMDGMKVAIVKGYSSLEYVKTKYPKMIIVPVKDNPAGLQMVSFGRADAMITDLAVASYFIETLGITNLRVAGSIDYVWELCFASRKDWPQLTMLLEKVLNTISEPERLEIKNKWISLIEQGWRPGPQFWITLSALIVLISIIAIFIWNMTLRHQVKAKTINLQAELTERKRAEETLRVSHRFLGISNRHMEMSPLLKEFVVEVQNLTGCAAAGLRMLDEEGNIPYEAYVGFSHTFYESESPLSIKSDQCMCINVIKGVADTKHSFYTKGGSFYMNGTTRFLATVSEEEKGQTRNVCNQVGYESVALVPIRVENRILGLIHMADPRENMCPLEVVEVIEVAGMQLGSAIQRVWTEEALAAERERLLVTLRSIGDGVITTDTKGNILIVNSVAELLTGWTQEEALGKPLGQVYHIVNEKSRQLCENPVEKVMQTGRIVGANHTALISKDGIERIIADSGSPIRDAQGNIIGVVLVFRDITVSMKRLNDQLKLEIEKLKRTEAALIESEEKYRSLVESTDDSIYLIDQDCNYLFMNTRHQERLGLPLTQIKGKSYGVCHSKQETDALREKVKILFETGKPLSYEYQSERDGHYFIRTLSPVMDGQTLKAVSVISKDITVQRQVEREAHRNRLELAHLERVATMGELAAALVHELSQPLTALLSNAQAALRFIQSNPPEIDELRATIQDIIADDRRAIEFIQHLRAFFKKGTLDKKSLNINSLINDVISLFKSEAVFRHIFIETALDIKLPAVLANEIHLQQVILNLVLNASESMMDANDRPKRVVIFTMRESASYLKIGVRDSGKGIDKDKLKAIFNPYFTAKKDGMGMGLAICRTIIKAHGGKIWAENNPNQGATFYFTLPIADEG